MEQSCNGLIDYQQFLQGVGNSSSEVIISFLMQELPYVWRDKYVETTTPPTNIICFQYGSFQYVYDDYASLEATGAVPYNPNREARLVAAFGISAPHKKKRDDYRLKNWVGSTETMFGSRWDKAHFIAHSIGGAVDGMEANVFVQRRDTNRGWSPDGRRFRKMEQYCATNASTFCFSRPLYNDLMAKPAFVEFGILKLNGELWVECFDNR